MNTSSKAYLVGGGIGSLAAAAFLIRDGGLSGANISILEAGPLMGGSLDGAGDAEHGYSMRGGRMLTTDNYECTWALFKSIPSLTQPGQSVFDETMAFNAQHVSHAMARLVDKRLAKVPVASMGFSMQDRLELLKLSNAAEADLGASRITDHLSPAFFETPFWFMWSTTFAFQPWHSAVEFRRYLHRFLLEFSRIETLAGVKRTIYNQYDSLVLPLQHWLLEQGVRLISDCTVTGLDHTTKDDEFVVVGLHGLVGGQPEIHAIAAGDLVFVQNGSMTDASSLGSMTQAPPKLGKTPNGGWTLWEKLAFELPGFGNPAAFNSCVAQSYWASFTVTLKDTLFRPDAALQRQRGRHRWSGDLQGFELAAVHRARAPAALHQPASRCAGVLGLRTVSRPYWQLCRQTHGRLHRRGDFAGAVWSPAVRPGHGGHGQLHPVPYAVHHQHVHATCTGRPATAGAAKEPQPGFCQPVCRAAAGRGVHCGIFGAGGTNGGLPVAGHHAAHSICHTARQVASRTV